MVPLRALLATTINYGATAKTAIIGYSDVLNISHPAAFVHATCHETTARK
jgi:hypothetical protein